MKPPDWYPDWSGETVVIVASGPSAREVPVETAKGVARFVAVNNSWQLCPWADILFAGDFAWWARHDGCPQFDGIRISSAPRVIEHPEWGVRLLTLRRDNRLHWKPGTVGLGGCSGFGALNMVVQFAPARILLVGYDVTLRYGAHWHPDHPPELRNPSRHGIPSWRNAIDGAAESIARHDIEVVNCSAVSMLRKYRKADFVAALAA